MTTLAFALVDRLMDDAAKDLRVAEETKQKAFAKWAYASVAAKTQRDEVELYRMTHSVDFQMHKLEEKVGILKELEKLESSDLAAYIACSDTFKKVGNTFSDLLDLKTALVNAA
jgi:hypothetical protein